MAYLGTLVVPQEVVVVPMFLLMKVRVLQGTARGRRLTPLEDAYDQFRLERQGNRLSPRTLASYDYHLEGFF